jgi:hypothetical protein
MMRLNILVAAVFLAMASLPAFGQAQPNQPQGRGNRGNFDPQQARQRMEDRLKEQLGVSDDEWKALQPKVEKVMDAQRDAMGGRGMGRGGRRGGDPNASPTAPTTPVQEKARELQSVLDNKDAKPEEIKSALSAYRDARTKARADLSKAQDELRELLTNRQESVLVMMGMLE